MNNNEMKTISFKLNPEEPDEPKLTPKQKAIEDHEGQIEKKNRIFYLNVLEKQRRRHEEQLRKYNLKHGLH
jgi:hypothetical protein